MCQFTATLPKKGSRSRMSSLSEAFLRKDYFSREPANSDSFTGWLREKCTCINIADTVFWGLQTLGKRA
jgi:hypothetical protein